MAAVKKVTNGNNGNNGNKPIIDDSVTIITATGLIINGGNGKDTLNGGEGDDTINGGNGTDILNGGAGNDVLSGDNGSDTLNGDAGNDSLYGGNGADTLSGGEGNDLLDGGLGGDKMSGGAGNDTYIVDSVPDKITEGANAGADTVETSLTKYTLGANLENLGYTGTKNFTGTGNAGDNQITGGAGNDTLNGLGGNDTLIGGLGNDKLYGGTGNDRLDGGSGNDTMTGGTGNDTYVVDSLTDQIIEKPGEGNDTVETSLNPYTLASNLENLVFTGIGDFTGTGNDQDNRLVGGSGNDTLIGLGGNDTLDGGAGNDTMSGGTGDDTFVVDSTLDQVIENPGEGHDTVQTSLNSYTLGSDVEDLAFTGSGDFAGTGNDLANNILGGSGNDLLSGLGGDDTLNGGAGNDTLNGGDGNNTLTGGLGSDTYVVDNIGTDLINENFDEGLDTVQTSLNSYTLGSNLENLAFTGSGNFTGTGNELDNSILGNSGNDTLNGSSGNDSLAGGLGDDYLIGGLGNDILNGGDGADLFLLNALSSVDTDVVQGFTVGTDNFQLDSSVLAGIFATSGDLDVTLFGAVTGTSTEATDATQRIIYNSDTGNIYYDADGNTTLGNSVLIGHVTDVVGGAISNTDFTVI